MFFQRGSWQDCVCTKRGMSPSALSRWSIHLQDFRTDPDVQTLTTTHPQAVRVIQLCPEDAVSWQVRCESGDLSSVVHVTVHFFQEISYPPTQVRCGNVQVISARDACLTSIGTFQASTAGTLLLEVELQTRGPVDINACLTVNGSSKTPAKSDASSQMVESSSVVMLDTRSSNSFSMSLIGFAMLSILFLYVVSKMVFHSHALQGALDSL